jgi:hypothetical protein
MTILGTLSIRDWDIGCYLTLGSEIVTYTIDGDTRAQYVVDIAGIDSEVTRFQNKVPVFFDAPEDPYQDFILPSFVFKRNSFRVAFDRQPYACAVARGPSHDAIPVTLPTGETGWSKYEVQRRGDPYDISYDLNIYGRRRVEANLMLAHVMRVMRAPWFDFKVVDSLGDVRYYDAGEMDISNTSELADIADRIQSETFSFMVHAEIDTFEDVVSPAMTDPRVTMHMGV